MPTASPPRASMSHSCFCSSTNGSVAPSPTAASIDARMPSTGLTVSSKLRITRQTALSKRLSGYSPPDGSANVEVFLFTISDPRIYETAAKFVATFRDGHTGYSTPSLFLADLGVYVDIYDNKVLVEQI